jgi:hypothetical protein
MVARYPSRPRRCAAQYVETGVSGYRPLVDENTDESLLDRLRGTGVGVEDPNIVGDVGPTDIPPGRDGDSDGLLADPPDPTDSVEPPDLMEGETGLPGEPGPER